MKKKLVTLLLILLTSVILADNFGADIFNQETDIYFTSKEVNIYDLENNDLKELKQILDEYKFFKGINIYEQLKNREYSVVYERTGQSKKFFILISLAGETISLPDNGFETEEMNDLVIKYTLGDEQYIYAYDENQLILSNDMTLFFLTIESDVNEKKSLNQKEKFAEMMNEDLDFAYKYYVETEDLVDEKYISLAKAYFELKSGGFIKKDYLLDGSEREYKTFDLTDYIYNNYSEIQLGIDSKIVKSGVKRLIPEFKLYDESKIDMYLKNNLEMAVNVKIEVGEYTLITLGDYASTEEFIKQMFGEAIFYNGEIELTDAETYKYYELPLLFRKIYFFEAGRFLMLTDNLNIVEMFSNAEIYNENFVDTLNYDEVTIKNNKLLIKSNAENILLEIENYIK